jgi:hypothetical protein
MRQARTASQRERAVARAERRVGSGERMVDSVYPCSGGGNDFAKRREKVNCPTLPMRQRREGWGTRSCGGGTAAALGLLGLAAAAELPLAEFLAVGEVALQGAAQRVVEDGDEDCEGERKQD